MTGTGTTRRRVLQGGLAAVASAVLPGRARALEPAVLDDASHLSATPVAHHVWARRERGPDLVALLRRELRDAAAAGRPVAVGAARHSMGGQSLAAGGTVFTLAAPVVEPDGAARRYRVAAGTRWSEVIAALDPLGFSPLVMQSNNDFGVASTLSVNAHGWPVPHPPFASTVEALRLMLADGSIVTCSRTETADLFRHVAGGYGLCGIILDLDVAMTPNALMLPRFEALPGDGFGARFAAACADPAVSMAYGRLDVARGRFLEDALLITFRAGAPPAGGLPAAVVEDDWISDLVRWIYRAEIGSDRAKRMRWLMETWVAPWMGRGGFTRNRLLNEGAARLADHDPRRTDILHEYFVPPARFAEFLAACRAVIPETDPELLNVTLRWLAPDRDSVLAYAPTERISAVMSFTQARTAAADAAMQRMTRALTERVLALGGSFYLPYRIHATAAQRRRAYPAVDGFAAFKRTVDPRLLFRNALWDRWLAAPDREAE